MKQEKWRNGAKQSIKLRNIIRADTDGCTSEVKSNDEPALTLLDNINYKHYAFPVMETHLSDWFHKRYSILHMSRKKASGPGSEHTHTLLIHDFLYFPFPQLSALA